MNTCPEWIPSLWTDTFDKLLSDELEYEDQWSLKFNYSQSETVSKEEQKRGWKVHTRSAYAKFQCESCKKTWSSGLVLLLFRYRLRGDRGTVIMRPFGQACLRCKNVFVRPGFYKKEVKDTLLGLYRKIRKNCYGEVDYGGAMESKKISKAEKPHASSLCEACSMGICDKGDEERYGRVYEE